MEEILIPASSCSLCETSLATDQIFCTGCGYPENGTESEQSKFHANRAINKSKTKEADKRIKSARNTLFVIAGISFLYGVVLFFTLGDSSVLISAGILAIIYLILGFWSQQKPLMALVLALLVYLTTITINAIVEPTSLFSGIIWKVVIIAFLGKGINSALHLRKEN